MPRGDAVWTELTYQYVFTDQDGLGIPSICSVEGTGSMLCLMTALLKIALNRIGRFIEEYKSVSYSHHR